MYGVVHVSGQVHREIKIRWVKVKEKGIGKMNCKRLSKNHIE